MKLKFEFKAIYINTTRTKPIISVYMNYTHSWYEHILDVTTRKMQKIYKDFEIKRIG